jgi:anti-sigma factor RsiW
MYPPGRRLNKLFHLSIFAGENTCENKIGLAAVPSYVTHRAQGEVWANWVSRVPLARTLTMKCDFVDAFLHSYLDGELSAFRTVEFERHMLHCADCGSELVAQDFLKSRLQVAQLYEPAPASLRMKIGYQLQHVAPTTAVAEPTFWHWRQWLTAAVGLLLVAIVAWRISPSLRTGNYQAEFAAEIVDAHMHSLQPGHITAIASNDERAVKRWFEDKVKFVLPVRDFASNDFALQGGRLDIIEGRPVAALVYARRGNLINVFIWPTPEPDASAHAGSRQGYQWIDWRKGQLNFCAVSDADPADLEQLRQLIAG